MTELGRLVLRNHDLGDDDMRWSASIVVAVDTERHPDVPALQFLDFGNAVRIHVDDGERLDHPHVTRPRLAPRPSTGERYELKGKFADLSNRKLVHAHMAQGTQRNWRCALATGLHRRVAG